MAGDSGKRSSGQPFTPPPASVWNNMVSAGEDFARQQLGNPRLEDPQPRPTDIVKVKNTTGGDLDRGDAIQFTGCLLDNAPRGGEFWFEGKQPDPAVVKPYGVLLRPLPNGSIGEAQISGMCWCKIDDIYADHRFVHIKRKGAKSNVLQTDWVGRGVIYYKVQVASQWWAAVNLSNFQAPELLATVTQEYGINAGSSGEVTIVDDDTTVTSPAQTETAYFDWMVGSNPAPEDAEARIAYSISANKWRVVNLGC